MERDCKNGPSMGLQATLKAGKGGSVISPVIQGHSLSNVTINITGSHIQNDDKQRRASSADQLLIEEVKSHHKSMLLRKFEHVIQYVPGEVDCLNLRSFRLREQGVLRMLPIAKHYKRVILSHCCLTSQSCADVSHLLMSQHSQLTELELTWNILMDAGIKLLCSGLTHPNCRLRKLGLRQCGLTSLSCEDLAMVLTTMTSLRELELSRNLIGDRGVSQLSIGLCHPTCRLQKLKLQGCELTAGCLGDEGVKLLVSGLRDPCCHLETLCLHSCGLTAASCEAMGSVLASEHSSLRVLVLALNALGDEGLNALCVGLQSPHSKLEELGLEFCTLTSAASSAIQSSALELSELNLTKNRLTDAAIEALIPALREPSSKLCNVNLLGAQVSWALKGELASVLAEVRQSGKDISFQLEPNKTL
ncbi:hypothetical protein AGOR_G00235150 [Albula goreensis]|uniref:Uncharacterized protein n=1 Tax=Albula goreensis TaxID=1534307 RepID=A0A8T3CLZ2_9TELE|nr:hypothetical protein AGOR_G00235150 [Albula goreensis]